MSSKISSMTQNKISPEVGAIPASHSSKRFPPRFLKPRSITGRLTLFYALSAIGMLTIASVFLYLALAHHTDADDRQFLIEKSHAVIVLLKNHPEDTSALDQVIRQEGGHGQMQKYYARIIDDQYRLRMESPDIQEISKGPIPFPEISTADEGAHVAKRWRSPAKNTYLLLSSQIGFGLKGKPMILQLALDISRDEHLLMTYRHLLIVVLLLDVIVSSALGITLTKSGLRPLEQIARTVQRITASQLHERIGRTQWPEELKTLAGSFDGMMDRLEDSFTRISALSADMAHELRTPINNLRGGTEVLLARSRSPEEYRQALESHLEEYEKLSRMIDSILFLARAENHQLKIQRSTWDVSKEILSVMEYHENVAEEKKVKLFCSGEARLKGDPVLFRRAISNILSNALQYTPSGGEIRVNIQGQGDLPVRVSVEDTGIGIAPEHLEKIFNRFYRADNAKSLNPQGTGLGLAIVKTITELHGGKICISSEISKGTKVLLSFPALS